MILIIRLLSGFAIGLLPAWGMGTTPGCKTSTDLFGRIGSGLPNLRLPPLAGTANWATQAKQAFPQLHEQMAKAYSTPEGKKYIESLAMDFVRPYIQSGSLPGSHSARWHERYPAVKNLKDFFDALDSSATEDEFRHLARNVQNQVSGRLDLIEFQAGTQGDCDEIQRIAPRLIALYLYAQHHAPQHLSTAARTPFESLFGPLTSP